MHTRNGARAITPRVWRDLAALAAEAVAIGVVFSVLLALAVLVMMRARSDDGLAGASVPVATAATTVASR